MPKPCNKNLLSLVLMHRGWLWIAHNVLFITILKPWESIHEGCSPSKIWQMDVTHVSEFGTVKYVHMSVSVDTWCHSRHTYVG